MALTEPDPGLTLEVFLCELLECPEPLGESRAKETKDG